jgi:antitoxin ParD1/3/4
MPKNTSVAIGDDLSAFVESEVRSGRYGSASEVVRAGLRLLADHETRMRALREALVAGEESGEPAPFDYDAFIASRRAGNRHR